LEVLRGQSLRALPVFQNPITELPGYEDDDNDAAQSCKQIHNAAEALVEEVIDEITANMPLFHSDDAKTWKHQNDHRHRDEVDGPDNGICEYIALDHIGRDKQHQQQ